MMSYDSSYYFTFDQLVFAHLLFAMECDLLIQEYNIQAFQRS